MPSMARTFIISDFILRADLCLCFFIWNWLCAVCTYFESGLSLNFTRYRKVSGLILVLTHWNLIRVTSLTNLTYFESIYQSKFYNCCATWNKLFVHVVVVLKILWKTVVKVLFHNTKYCYHVIIQGLTTSKGNSQIVNIFHIIASLYINI
jgi:hypothetical protein